MATQSLFFLDAASSIQDALNALFTNLFTLPMMIAALVLTFVLAGLGWLIAYFFLRPKEICSMVCSIHFLIVILTIVLGMVGAFGIIDRYSGSLITGAGVALLVLTLPLFVLVESFNYVVLSNKHARRHRDLRTAQDRRVRRLVVFMTPLLTGAVLLGVGLVLSATVTTLTALASVEILLLTLWVLALGIEIISLARARQRRRRLAAMPASPMLDQEELAALWVSGFSSYRIGRGETSPAYWEVFTERVYITEELLLEEDGELDLVEVEEQETKMYAVAAGAAAGGAGSAALAPHQNHRSQRHPARRRFRRRWGSSIILLIIALIAVAIAVTAGTVATTTIVAIALAFLAPAVYLIIHRIRRDNDLRFATETTDRISAVQASTAAAQGRAGAAVAPARPRASSAQTPPALRPTRPTPVVPPATPPVIPSKEEPSEPPTLPSLESAEAASQQAIAAGQAHENPDIADDTLLMQPAPATPAPVVPASSKRRASRSIGIIQFQHFLHDAHYPTTRDQLLAVARKNNASSNMITRLEELDEHHSFINVRDVMIGYAYHRYLRDASYPATRDQLLAHIRANKAPAKLTTWLEGLDETASFANLTEVVRSYASHGKGEDEEEEDEEE